MKHAWIHTHRDSFPVAGMCDVLDVSTSGYYASIQRKPSQRSVRQARIRASVRQVHSESHGIDGSAKIAEELQRRDDLETACRHTVSRAMRELGLASRVSKALTPTTTQADPTKQPAPNKLDRDFTATEPNQKWVADITYLPTLTGWAYVAIVLDLFSRKVVGRSSGDSLATPLVAEALRRAIEARRPIGSELLLHSDRGCQYTSGAYQQTLRSLGVECSMSRTGECDDNAVAERFFWSLKHEWTKHEKFADLEAARLSVFKYVETFDNPVRLHQTLGYKSPDQFDGTQFSKFYSGTLSPATNPDAWALEMWVRPQGADPGDRFDYLLEALGGGNNRPGLLYDYGFNDKVEVFGGGGRTEAGGATLVNDAWQHLVIGNFGDANDRIDFYLNGVAAGSVAFTSNLPFGTDAIAVGNSVPGSPDFDHFAGQIDELALYDLTGQTVSAINGKLQGLATHYAAVPEPTCIAMALLTLPAMLWRLRVAKSNKV